LKPVNPKKTGLIVVDMLNDFVQDGGSLVVPVAKSLIPNQQELLTKARETGVYVIFLADNHQPDDDEFEKWPPHAIRGTWGSRVIEPLSPQDEERVVPKRRYSGFFGTDLDLTLRERGIDTVVIVGVLTDICVMYTSADASARGYNVIIVSDATGSTSLENHQFALTHAREVHGAVVTDTRDVLQALNPVST
jgi:nicotinamidase/pyrazinamidase